MDQRIVRAVAGAAAVFLAVLTAVLASPLPGAARALVSETAWVLGAVAVLAGAVLRRRRERGRGRRPWTLLAATGACWTAGNLIWLGLDVAGAVPAPSPSDVFYLAALPLAAGAVLSFPGWRTGPGLARSAVDGLVVTVSLLFVSWEFVLGPVVHRSDLQPVARAVQLAYPTADVVIVVLALRLALRVPRRGASAPLLVAVGLASYAVADTIWAWLALTGRYVPGDPADAGWTAGYLLLALATVAPAPRAGEGPAEEATWLATAVPYAAASAAVAHALLGHHLAEDPVLVGLGVALAALIPVRQFLILAENAALRRELEARVAARTAELEQARARFEALVRHAPDAIVVFDADGRARYTSPALARVTGYQPADLESLVMGALTHPDDKPRVMAVLEEVRREPGRTATLEYRVRHRSGRYRHAEVTATNLLADPSVRGLVFNVRDVTDRRELQAELWHRATHDPLTDLANRSVLRERVEAALARDPSGRSRVAIVILDLDGFKLLNDTLGHAAGDQVLLEVGHRLLRSVRPGDTVARLGGDEFAVLVEDVTSPAVAEQVAERVIAALGEEVDLGHTAVAVAASVGVAISDPATRGFGELMRNADLAMYAAKAGGKGRWQMFEPSMHAAVLERFELERELRRALRNGELFLDYQPIVDARRGTIDSVEALVRWRHPRRGVVPPGEFIPLAEESGLIVELGRWVLLHACRTVREWDATLGPGRPPLDLTLNVSMRQAHDATLVDDLRRTLEETGLAPERLVLEITETLLMEDGRPLHGLLSELEALGVRLAIDDFGTGYSSLGRLRRLPISVLKIDKSFVNEITDERCEAPLVAAIIAMAHGVELQVVAEGVETPEQLVTLRRLGCDKVQGYLLSRPVDATTLASLLRAGSDTSVGLSALSAPELAPSTDEAELMRQVEAILGRHDELRTLTRPLLEEVLRLTGLESAYLTRIDWDRAVQHIEVAENRGQLTIPEGAEVRWSDTLCRRALLEERQVTDDVPATWPDSEAARALGIQTYVSVPVTTPDGRLYGTLCGASSRRHLPRADAVEILELFARLIGSRLPTAETAAGR